MKTISAFVAAALSLSAFARDDEPDGLSWEIFSKDRDILLHFYDWAKANPPPSQTCQTSQTYQTSQTFPCVWIKPAELPFDGAGWRTGVVSRAKSKPRGRVKSKETVQEKVLIGKGQRSGICKQTIEIPEDGKYRLWVRYRHRKGGNEPNSITLIPEGGVFPAAGGWFGKTNGYQLPIGRSRPKNPVPRICDVETPWDGFYWEATRGSASLAKGKYLLQHGSAWCDDVVLADIVLVGDPFFSPEGMTRETSGAMRLPVPEETKSPLYAIRPGSQDVNEAPPELADWWRRWRTALWDKAIAAEHTKDYVWGNIADLKAFDERLNTIGRVSQLRKLAEKTAKPSDTYRAYGDEFKPSNDKWTLVTGRYDKVVCARALQLAGVDSGKATWRVRVRRAGTYYLNTLVYLPRMADGFARSALRLKVLSGGKVVGEKRTGSINAEQQFKNVVVEAGPAAKKTSLELDTEELLLDEETTIEDGVVKVERKPIRADEGASRNLWCKFGPFELPAGEAEVVAEDAGAFWEPEKKGRYTPRVLCRAVLTQCDDYGYNPWGIERPQGDRVGPDEIGFWLSPDPWTALTRYSPAATGRCNYPHGYAWTPIAADEVNRAEHEIEAASGEVRAELLVIRNNTAETRWIEPRPSGDLGGRVRVVTWSTRNDGNGFPPRFLLERRRIALPPYQNVALHVDIDCRGAKEGAHRFALDFGGRTHAWNVRVKGSIEGVRGPYVNTWSAPPFSKRHFKQWHEFGFNVLVGAEKDPMYAYLTKDIAKEYDFRLFRLGGLGFNTGYKEPEKTAEYVKKTVADWRHRGFDYTDFSFCLSAEIGFEAKDDYVKTVKVIKDADSNAQIWFHSGFFPDEKQWDACEEYMGCWDVFCPFWHAILPRGGRNAEHLAAFRKLGRVRFAYFTPSHWQVYEQLDGAREPLQQARICREAGLDGWAFVWLTSGWWDLDYPASDVMFPGAWNRMISTRYGEGVRAATQWWRKMDAGVIAK